MRGKLVLFNSWLALSNDVCAAVSLLCISSGISNTPFKKIRKKWRIMDSDGLRR